MHGLAEARKGRAHQLRAFMESLKIGVAQASRLLGVRDRNLIRWLRGEARVPDSVDGFVRTLQSLLDTHGQEVLWIRQLLVNGNDLFGVLSAVFEKAMTLEEAQKEQAAVERELRCELEAASTRPKVSRGLPPWAQNLDRRVRLLERKSRPNC